jgi:hypothetical protein
VGSADTAKTPKEQALSPGRQQDAKGRGGLFLGRGEGNRQGPNAGTGPHMAGPWMAETQPGARPRPHSSLLAAAADPAERSTRPPM